MPRPAGAALLDRVSDPVVVLDRTLTCVLANGAACALLGRPPGELVGRTLHDTFPDAIGTGVERHYRSALERQEAVELEAHVESVDRWYTVRAVPSGDGLTLTFHDSSARHAADRALEVLLDQSRRQQRLAAVLAETNEAVFRSASPGDLFEAAVRIAVEQGGLVMSWIGVLDPETGDVAPVASAGEAALGYLKGIRITTNDEPAGLGVGGMALRSGIEVCSNDILTDTNMRPWRAAAATAGYRSSGAFPLRVGGRVAGLMSVYAAEPGYFDTEETSLVRRLAANVSYGWESLERQAALRQSEAERERSDRLESLGKLAGGVAHDFNNLLGVILNYTTLLDKQVGAPQARADLRAIRAAAERGADLTRQLLSFARRDPANPEPLHVNACVSDVASMLERALGPSIELRLRLDERPLVAVADRHQLDQAILNLGINARDAMPDGGVITISTELAADATGAGGETAPAVVIRVEDTGVGMAPDVAARAFEPFFTTKPRGEGTGLGLAAVHGIVTRSGGRADIASVEGEGTTVTLTLPLSGEALTPESAAHGARAAPPGARQCVLLVEDDPTLRDATARIIAGGGYRVVVAADGVEALEVLERRPEIALVLTDVVMPRLRGDELAAVLRERAPWLPVSFMTGYDSGEVPPGERVLLKPVDEHHLLGMLREVLHA